MAGSADADAMFDQSTTRARARDLDRNEALARGFLDSASSSVISTGLRYKPNPNWRLLGKTPQWAKAWRQQVRDILVPYLESTDVDATRHSNLGGLSSIALRNMMMSGSVLASPCTRRTRSAPSIPASGWSRPTGCATRTWSSTAAT